MEERLVSLEDTVEELKDELRFVKAELRALRREVRGDGLSSRGSVQEDQASLASVVSFPESQRGSQGSQVARSFNEHASRSRSDPVSQAPAGSRSPTPSTHSAGSSRCPLSWLEREAICDEIGLFVRRALAGDHRGTSGRDRINLSSRIWLVFKDYEGLEYRPVLLCRTFAECREKVKRGEDTGESVFVGLPSEREACRVASSAGIAWPTAQQR